MDRLNMMFNENFKDTCSSPDMDIIDSYPDLVTQSLAIFYKDMLPEKISGQEIRITCHGFKNPIFEDKWYGF